MDETDAGKIVTFMQQKIKKLSKKKILELILLNQILFKFNVGGNLDYPGAFEYLIALTEVKNGRKENNA